MLTITNSIPFCIVALAVAAGATFAGSRRLLLVNRCIQCHAPPNAAKLSPERLRRVLATMSRRAHLSPEEHEAVLHYLLAVHSL
ncbi:MAG: Quinohemoprotein amine dehydrogenase alpha subunit, hem binding [Verrucomicrobiota bacterium]|jgi:hypothetical protein